MTETLIWLRAVHVIATTVACGTIGFVLLVGDPAAAGVSGPASSAYAGLRRRLMIIAWVMLALTALSGAAWLVWVAADIVGEPMAAIFTDGSFWQVVSGTRFGTIASLRLAVAVVLGLSIAWPSARTLSIAAAAALIGLLAWTGHAGATPGTAGLIPLMADVSHLVAAAAWLGGLPALAMLLAMLLAMAGRLGHAEQVVVGSVRRFSILGIVSVGTLTVTGIVNSTRLLGGLGHLWTSDYGRLLALKVALFAAMVAIAAINRQRLTPRMSEPGAIRALYRNSLTEFALGLGVLILVAILGTMNPPARMHRSSAESAPDVVVVHIHTTQAMADVRFGSPHARKNGLSIQLWREDGAALGATDLKLLRDPWIAGDKPIEAAVVSMPDGHWEISNLTIPHDGA